MGRFVHGGARRGAPHPTASANGTGSVKFILVAPGSRHWSPELCAEKKPVPGFIVGPGVETNLGDPAVAVHLDPHEFCESPNVREDVAIALERCGILAPMVRKWVEVVATQLEAKGYGR